MGRTKMLAIAAVVALICASGMAASTASSVGLQVGDVLVYDLTIEIQIHSAPQPTSTQAPVTLDTTMQGTETMTGLSADPDGSVHASLDVAVRGKQAGSPVAFEQKSMLKLSPDGTIRIEGGGTAAQQYADFLNQAAKGFAGRTLHVGDVIHRTVPGPQGFSSSIETTAKVVGEKQYRGYPTFAIQSTGSGKIDTQSQGAHVTGGLTVAGTTYYDQADVLLIGEAVRTNVDGVVTGPQGGRLNVVTTMNIVLESRTHGARGVAPGAASPAPSATSSSVVPAPTPTPVPTPTSGYYTPTPPAVAPTSVPATTRP